MKSPFIKLVASCGLLLLVAYALIALQGPQGIPALIEKRRLIREYEKRNAEMARKNEEQRARIGRFNDGSNAPEMQIRQRLKLLKPGEKVFMLQDAPAAQSAPAPQKQEAARP